MQIEKKVLKNKASIIGAPINGTKTVAMAFGFRTGSRNEDSKYAGISHFLEHMMFKGSRERPSAKAISVEIDKIGANYNAFTGKEYTYYYIETTPENFNHALDVLGDMSTRPIIDEKELQKEKGTIIEEIRMYEDNPMINIFGKMEQTIFGFNTALGRDIAGTEETVTNIDSKVMKEYFTNTYCAENAIAVIAGHLPKNYQKLAEKYLKNLSSGSKSSWQKPTFSEKKSRLIYKKTEQSHFGICFPGYELSNPKKYAADIVSTVLGGYMSSRLFTEIREKRGWAYRVWAFHDSYSDTGVMGIFGGLKLDKTEEAIKIAKSEALNLSGTITDEEIERAKSHIKGASVLKYDNSQNLATLLGLNYLLEGKVETPEEYLKKIESTTKEEIIKVAKEVFQANKMYLTIIGPFKDQEKFAKILSSTN